MFPRFPAAVIGTGFIGPVHVEGLRRAGVPVVGVLGSTPAKSSAMASRLGIPNAYGSMNELLSDPTVRVVHITSPNRYHLEQSVACLKAGKHVMCEKPLAMTSEESSTLVRLARESGLACGVNYNVRYYPNCLEAAERRKNGELGSVFHVAGSYVQDWLFHPTDFNWRVLASEGGELRAIADIGTHWLDLIHAITGLEVESLCADLSTIYPVRQRPTGSVETFSSKINKPVATEDVEIDTEDYGSILLRFQGGARGVMWVSQVTAGRKNSCRFEIAGSKQSLAWDSQDPNNLWIGLCDQPNQLLVRDPALLSPAAAQHADYPGGHNEGFPDTFKQCFRAFYNAIAKNEWDAGNFPTFRDGHREIVLCEAILKSARQRSWIDVPQV